MSKNRRSWRAGTRGQTVETGGRDVGGPSLTDDIPVIDRAGMKLQADGGQLREARMQDGRGDGGGRVYGRQWSGCGRVPGGLLLLRTGRRALGRPVFFLGSFAHLVQVGARGFRSTRMHARMPAHVALDTEATATAFERACECCSRPSKPRLARESWRTKIE